MKTLSLAAVLLLTPLIATAQSPAWKRAPGASWICAGVGSDERRALDELRPQAKLEVRFVTEKRGAYLAGVEWALIGSGSSTPLVQGPAEGPVCLVDAPPGAYRIEATYGGTKKGTRAVIGGKGMALATVAFPDAAWNGISASPEEKRQAAAP